jgi:hypothetical protein
VLFLDWLYGLRACSLACKRDRNRLGYRIRLIDGDRLDPYLEILAARQALAEAKHKRPRASKSRALRAHHELTGNQTAVKISMVNTSDLPS